MPLAVAEVAVDQEPSFPRENSARVVWILAWPAVALNSLQVINTLLDRWFTGSLTDSALTGYGGTSVVTFLMFSLGLAVATGATALVSRGFGAGDTHQVKTGAQEALSLSIFGGILTGAVTALLAGIVSGAVLPPSDHQAQIEMTRFLVAYACGLPALTVIQTLAGSLRGIGDTRSPMYISGVKIFLHMTLNVLLIFPTRQMFGITIPGAGLGLMGAGAALASSAWISAIAYLLYIPRTPLGPLSPIMLPNLGWSLRILRIAVPAAVMSALRVFSLAAFTLVLKQVADASAAIAAMSIGFALESIMFMPSFGLSAAAAALVGQSLGMKRPERAERLAWTAAHHAALVTLCLAVPIFAGAMAISLNVTHGKIAISQESTALLRCLCLTEVFFAYTMVLVGAMQGAGDTVRPLWITVIAQWLLRVPSAIILALPSGFQLGGMVGLPLGFGLGAQGAWWSMAGTQAVQGVMAVAAFKAGHWKTEQV